MDSLWGSKESDMTEQLSLSLFYSNNIERILRRSLAICMSFWRNTCLGLLPIFWTALFVFSFFVIELHELFVPFGD